jgi:hypothetical protein
VGAIVYRFFIAAALNSDFIGLKAQDLNLVTALLVTVALVIPQLKRKWSRKPDAPTIEESCEPMLSAKNSNSPSTPARPSKPARCAACRWTFRTASLSPSSAPTAPASPPS